VSTISAQLHSKHTEAGHDILAVQLLYCSSEVRIHISGNMFDMFRTCGDVERGMSRIWVVGWIDRAKGGRGRWKFRISVSANTEVTDMTSIAQKPAVIMVIGGRSIVVSRKYVERGVN